MAGHSHWANIAAKKSRIDKKRGKLFGKLSRAIIVAARNGGGDPVMNLTLRYAIDKARKASMPADNIDRAIKKGTGDSDGEDYEELVYEGYGPEGVAILCDALTENRNRTAGEIRKIFEVHNGKLGQSGCVSYMFDRKGLFVIPAEGVEEDALFELTVEAGADDVVAMGDAFQVTCSVDVFSGLSETLEKAGIRTTVAEFSRIPQNTIELDAAAGRKVFKLLDVLEDNDDIQSVTANFSIPDEIMEEVVNGLP
jgi:YebC/PmpR family DNA-binding regulatory protein